jgi:hypothetical protein
VVVPACCSTLSLIAPSCLLNHRCTWRPCG